MRLDGRPLSPDEATTVRVRDGQVLVCDCPFAETKELMVGYDMLGCADIDEAIEVPSASARQARCHGTPAVRRGLRR